MLKIGDLVKYTAARYYGSDWAKEKSNRVGIVIKILNKDFERKDNILVQWSDGRAWCVMEDWIKVVNDG